MQMAAQAGPRTLTWWPPDRQPGRPQPARALETLKRVDAICAEDTRHTRQLLAHFGLERPLWPCTSTTGAMPPRRWWRAC